MFERFKKAVPKSNAPVGHSAEDESVSEWAVTKGFAFSGVAGDAGGRDKGSGFALNGHVGNKPWRLECGKSSRDFIHGDELRARAELQLNDEVSVLVMNRPLKEALEKRAYAMYTDTLQTTVDPSLPEEMRWLAMYPETRWDSLAPEFWNRYSILAENRDQAMAWIDHQLADLLMNWPESAPNDQVPFILMILRGKVYLRMQYTPADMPTLEHAAQIFTHACESGVSELTADIPV
jgi:hypothetical protein